MEYCKLLFHIKTIEMKLKGLWCMIGDKKEIEKNNLKANEKLASATHRSSVPLNTNPPTYHCATLS
jgi:hypothetical protein